MSPHNSPYARRVRELEAEGLTTSDAQGVADVEHLSDEIDFPGDVGLPWNPESLPAASWCPGVHIDGLGCASCAPILQSHLDHKGERGT